MSAVVPQLVTAADLWRLHPPAQRCELVRGVLVERLPPGGQHGAIAVALAMLLRLWTRSTSGGYVGVEAGFILARGPDTVRGPDVSYVRVERLPAAGVPEGFWDIAPDLAVEVVSPSETADEVREKVRDFLAAGTPLVWTMYPRTREVIAHTPDGIARTFAAGDTLSFPDVLPGFSCTVDELFA